MDNKKSRRLDLSGKFVEMAQALMLEGKENKDLMVSQSGSILLLLGGLMYDEADMNLFAQIASMFSSKKVLDNLEANNNDYSNFIKNKNEIESYDDFIKRINDIKDKNKEDEDND